MLSLSEERATSARRRVAGALRGGAVAAGRERRWCERWAAGDERRRRHRRQLRNMAARRLLGEKAGLPGAPRLPLPAGRPACLAPRPERQRRRRGPPAPRPSRGLAAAGLAPGVAGGRGLGPANARGEAAGSGAPREIGRTRWRVEPFWRALGSSEA